MFTTHLGVTDTLVPPPIPRPPALCLGLLLLPGIFVLGAARGVAQTWNGSVRVDYQTTPGTETHGGLLSQQYYLRVIDRLFYKNQLSLIGNFDYRSGRPGQPPEFRPRYALQLSSHGYGGQLAYEPIRQQSGTVQNAQSSHRWRANVFAQPLGWPRFTYDLQRLRDTVAEGRGSRDRWDSYGLSWQPRASVLSASYSRQVRTQQQTPAEILEVYRVGGSTERSLPWRHHVNLGYNFDRTWSQRRSVAPGAQDQHTATANLSGQPVSAVNWSAQYSGRFLTLGPRRNTLSNNSADHLASASVTVTPARALNFGVLRYFERIGDRVNQPGNRTDYWQTRLASEGRMYRQIRAFATVYRIIYTGAPTGRQYSDAYLLTLRGRPFRHTDWSSELSLSDQHGRQTERYGGSMNTYVRLEPLPNAQAQAGYSASLTATQIGAIHISEESYNSNLQYLPSPDFSLAGSWGLRRNRLLMTKWVATWSMTGTYRWPSFASISMNYSARQIQTAPNVTPVPGTGKNPSTFVAELLWWADTRTTVTAQYNHQNDVAGLGHESWGLGFSTQF